MIFALIIGLLLCISCLIWTIIAIKDREFGPAIFMFFFTFVTGVLVAVVIDAMCKDNKQMIEYRFSAEHYKFQEEVSVSRKTIYINGVEAVEESRDTTYVLTGIEPIIIDNNNYERNVVNE